MRLIERDTSIELRDTPGCLWLLGAWFVAGGAFAIAMPFIATNRHELGWGAKSVVILIGLGVLAGGAYTVASTRWFRLRLDPVTRRAVLERGRLLRGRETVSFAFDDVRSVEARPGRDSDGDPVFELRIWLRSGQFLVPHGQPLRGEDHARAQAERLRAALGVESERTVSP
jgi:hypothetical protein